MSYPDIESGILEEWQEITNLVASLCHVPAALVMRQNAQTMEVMSGSQHPDSPYETFETAPLNGELYCETVIKTQSPLHVSNALNDPDWDHNPDVELGMISYYGIPVNWPDGSPFGTICILDRAEKLAADEEKAVVKRFGRVIEMTLELIASNHALEKSQKWHLNLFEHSHDMIFILDLAKGEIVDVNPKVEGVIGYRPDELRGRPMIDLHPDEVPELMAFFSDVMQKGQGRTDTLTCLAKSGEKRFADISAFLIEEGGKQLAVAAVRDISKRKKIEEQLYSNMRLQSEIVQNIAEGISLIRAEDGVIVYANEKFEQMFGYRPGELDGKQVAILNAPTDKAPEEIAGEIIDILARDGQWAGEVQNLKKDGSLFWSYAAVSAFQHLEHGTVWLTAQRDISEHKQAEEALHESEKRYKLLTEVSPVGVFRTDAEGECTFINEQWSAMAGLTFEDAMDGGWAQSLHPDDRERVFEEWIHCAQNNINFKSEYRFKRPDGHITWVFGQAKAEIDNTGKIGGYVGTITDITDRKQSEEILRLERDMSQTYLDIAGVLFVTLNSQGEITMINRRGCEILGYSHGDIINRNWFDVCVSRDHQDEVKGVFNQLMNGEIELVEYYENPVLNKQGEEIIISFHNTLLTGSDGEVVGILSSGEDITERKEAEEGLQKSEAKYRHLVEGLKDEYFFYAHGVDGVFTYMSPSIQNVLGYQPEEYLIHYNDSFTDNPINQLASEKSEASIQGKRQQAYELEVRRKDNSICRLAVTEFPIFNETGEVVSVEGIAHDITEYKQAKEALELTQARHDEAQRIAHLGHWTLDLITQEFLWSDENYRIFGVEPGSANTYETFLETVHPDDRTFVSDAYTISVENRVPYNIEHRLLMKDGSIKWVNERCETEYADDGPPLRSMGTTLDITERKQLKNTLYFAAQRGWDVDGEDFFQALAIHLAKSLQVDFVIINRLLDKQRVKTVALYAKGNIEQNIEYPLSHTPCQKVVGSDLCYYPQGIQQLFPLDEMLVEMGAESYLGIPLWDSKGEALGLIALIDSKPMTNESQAKSLLQIVAVRVAAELERRGSDRALEQSREQLRALIEHIQAVREEEQKRIARDVHDVLGQLLTAINIDVSWIEEMLAEEQKDLRAKAQEVSEFVSEAIRKVQQISSTLRPTLLDDLGITAAIEWQVSEFQNRTGIRARFASTPTEIDVSGNLATEIYRIFQEAMTNVIRHAEASTMEVSLTKSDGRVTLEVRDDGRGITEKEINDSRSIGLLGIRERAYSLQGDVVIHGKPGKGSSVIVTFPTGGKR